MIATSDEATCHIHQKICDLTLLFEVPQLSHNRNSYSHHLVPTLGISSTITIPAYISRNAGQSSDQIDWLLSPEMADHHPDYSKPASNDHFNCEDANSPSEGQNPTTSTSLIEATASLTGKCELTTPADCTNI